MANTVKKMLFGPYVGFFFNGHHSAEFGICRVSDGDRYTINLAPTYKDITTDREGADGTWYERTEIISETYDINIASDVIDQTTLDELKEWLKPGVAGTLIFDETPYKGVVAQVVNNPTFSFTPFGELGTRTLKGTGQISFITYEPGIYPTSVTLGSSPHYYSFKNNYTPSIDSTIAYNRPRVLYENRISYLRQHSGMYNNSVRKNMINKNDELSADFFDWASEWWEGAAVCGIDLNPQKRDPTDPIKYFDGIDNIIINKDGQDYISPEHSSVMVDDYLGFFFNGHHSSEFGIMRVSKSDVYTENLTPSFTNITKSVSATDKTVSFGTHKSSIIFDIDFATDCMSLGDLEKIRQWINPKNYGEFYLDEEPNKKYLVKLYGNPTFSFIPFEDQRKVPFIDRKYYNMDTDAQNYPEIAFRTDGRTIHKGEGTISFIAYEITPQYVYSSIKEIGLDICAGGPYYRQYKNKFWKASDNQAVKNLFDNWTKNSKAQQIINEDQLDKKLLVNFMKWINEWKGTSDIPYVSTIEYGATNLNLDYTSNKINYQIVLDIPSDENQDYLENQYNLKTGGINFYGKQLIGENTWGVTTANSIKFIPRKISSSIKPNVIVIDSLSNTIRYAQRQLDSGTGQYVIKYLTELAPITFTSINNGIKSNNILPTNLSTICGQIQSVTNQPNYAYYNLWKNCISVHNVTYYPLTDSGLTDNIRRMNAEARNIQVTFKDRTRNGKSIWAERTDEIQHFTFYDYNSQTEPIKDSNDNIIGYIGGLVSQAGTQFKYNGTSLLNDKDPVQVITFRRKRLKSDIEIGGANELAADYDSNNFTMYSPDDKNYNANDKLQVILFSDELLRDLSDNYNIISLKVTNIEE